MLSYTGAVECRFITYSLGSEMWSMGQSKCGLEEYFRNNNYAHFQVIADLKKCTHSSFPVKF